MNLLVKTVLSSAVVCTLIAEYPTPSIGIRTFAAKTTIVPIPRVAKAQSGNTQLINSPAHIAAKTSRKVDKKSGPTMVSDGFLRVGTKVPSFDLKNLNRKGATSLKQLLGKKPLIINAWASWCPPCQLEAPMLEKASKRYGKQVRFIGVNLTKIDSIAGARKFTKRYHLSYPVLLDTSGRFWQSYTVISYPTTFVVSKTGRLLFAYQGSLTAPQIRQLVKIAEK